jgi:hypothetical protein
MYSDVLRSMRRAVGSAYTPLAAAAIAIALAGCGSEIQLPIYARDEGDAELQALAIGELELWGNCLVIQFDGYEEPHLVLWPPRTRWEASTSTVVSDGARARVGDVVKLGGGERYQAPADSDTWISPPCAECQEFELAWVASGIIVD